LCIFHHLSLTGPDVAGTTVLTLPATSGNVTSITDNGTGDYTVNLTTAMPDANYGITALGSGSTGNTWGFIALSSSTQSGTDPTTTTFRLRTTNSNGGSAADQPNVNAAIFR